MKDFREKVAVVTGAASGIGQQLAIQLHAGGASLALFDLDSEGLKSTARQVDDDSRCSLHTLDLTERDQVATAAREVLARHGSVDLLINNAGITLTPTPFLEIDEALLRRVIEVNMWGVYNGIREFLPALLLRPEATIVNVSSLAGLLGLYGYSPYVMSKFAVRGLTETLQSELTGSNVRLLSVHPGGVKTKLIQNAPDLRSAQEREFAHTTFSRWAFLTPEHVASRTLRAIKRGRRRLILGIDAHLVFAIGRLFPNRFPAILAPIFRQMDFKRPAGRLKDR